jgi:Holliday junction DNA helicase RuvA
MKKRLNKCNNKAQTFVDNNVYIQKTGDMIEYVKGELTDVTPALAVVEAAGVGYALNISLNTYSAIQGKHEVKLYVHEVLVAGGRDDSFTLYGFSSKQERELYRLLITVSGVGANSARMMLSAMSPSELCNVISSGNDKMLKTVKGIGLKTAQRIIVDLKDKIISTGIAQELPANGGNVTMVNNDVKEEAVSALTMLGFAPAPSAKVVVAILTEQPDMPVEQVVKLALKQIK